ncbi:MAG: alpha/beta fold hydrolase, partial [Acidimicrobiales bacterium]
MTAAASKVAAPALKRLRLEHRDVVLAGGHRVGVSSCGEGIPFVMIHALGGEGMLYARQLTRIASLGFRAVAVDIAGHGRSGGLVRRGWRWSPYVDLHRRALDTLEIDQAVLAGHSMGGKIAVEIAALEPQRALAVLAINAPIGRLYDAVTASFRRLPVLLPVGAGLLATDIAGTTVRARREMARNVALGDLGRQRLSSLGSVLRAFVATISDCSSARQLRQLRDHQVPTVVIHGDRDLAVWFASSRLAAEDADATLVRIHGGGHVWLLEDADTLPAVFAGLLDEGLLGRVETPAGAVVPSAPARQRWSIDRRPSSAARQ